MLPFLNILFGPLVSFLGGRLYLSQRLYLSFRNHRLKLKDLLILFTTPFTKYFLRAYYVLAIEYVVLSSENIEVNNLHLTPATWGFGLPSINLFLK